MALEGLETPIDSWRTSSFCDASGCVEVATTTAGIFVRNSTDPSGPVVGYTKDEWKAFVLGVKAGEFDLV